MCCSGRIHAHPSQTVQALDCSRYGVAHAGSGKVVDTKHHGSLLADKERGLRIGEAATGSLDQCHDAPGSEAPYQLASFRPTIPATISPMLARRAVVAGSWNNTIPRITVPTAPTPTQTA